MLINYKIYGLKIKGCDDIRYIGQTKQSLSRRFSNHICDFRNNTKKTNWIRKYRNDIEIILIEDGIKTLEECNNREIFYIKYYRGIGYNLINLTDGGYGLVGHKQSDEFRRNASERMKSNNPMKMEDIRNKVSNTQKGKTSPNKGKKINSENMRRIFIDEKLMYDMWLSGNYKQKELAEIFKCSHGYIFECIKKITKYGI